MKTLVVYGDQKLLAALKALLEGKWEVQLVDGIRMGNQDARLECELRAETELAVSGETSGE